MTNSMTKLFNHIQFEWNKRYHLLVLEIVFISFLTLLTLGQLSFFVFRTSTASSVSATSIMPRLKLILLSIDREFFVFAIIITFIVSSSVGGEFDSRILLTDLLQLKISKIMLLLGKVGLDFSVLFSAISTNLVLIYLFSPHHLLLSFNIALIFYFFMKLVFCYAFVLCLNMLFKEFLIPFILSVGFWLLIPILFPLIFTDPPLNYLFSIINIDLAKISHLDQLLFSLGVLFLLAAICAFILSFFIVKNKDLLRSH